MSVAAADRLDAWPQPIGFAGAAARFRARVPRAFLNVMTVLLAGYALFGRSFAYLGIPPLYVGELALAMAVFTLLMTRTLVRLAFLPQVWVLLALGVWGAVQTIPYAETYGSDAFRDASVWGYGAFAVVIAASLLDTGRLSAIVRRYGNGMFFFAAWVIAAFAIMQALGDRMPDMPGAEGVPLLRVKLGDAGVHLAGAAAFALTFGKLTGGSSRRRSWLFWGVWLVACACVISQNRGGFVAILAALGVVSLLDPFNAGRRVLTGAVIAGVLGALLLGAALTVTPDVEVGALDQARVLSPQQFAANLTSLVTRETGDATLDGTRDWRLEWWQEIAQYTFGGPYFWTGKGFGVNLSIDDGFVVSGEDNAPLRSPHDVHMTFLARAGVPGLALWILLQLTFGAGLLRAYFRARHRGAHAWAHLDLWLLAYWTAFLVNASFDVFLEGPQGGIWFWSVFGIGLAALAAQQSMSSEYAGGAAA